METAWGKGRRCAEAAGGRPLLGPRAQGDVPVDPGLVARHSGVHPGEGARTTDVAPAHDPHLEPGAVPAAHQGPPESPCGGHGAHLPSPRARSKAAVGPHTRGPARAEDRVSLGSHVAGTLSLAPSTQHVILDGPLGDFGMEGEAIDLVTDQPPHDPHLHLLQAGAGKWFCREKHGVEPGGPGVAPRQEEGLSTGGGAVVAERTSPWETCMKKGVPDALGTWRWESTCKF